MFDVRTRSPKPRWGVLYAVVGGLLGLLGTVEIVLAAGAPRRVLDLVGVVLLFGAMAVWVRCNRAALASCERGAVDAVPRPAPAGSRCPTCGTPITVDRMRERRK